MKTKGSNSSVNQGKMDKSKKFDNNISGTNDSKLKNSSLESSKKTTIKYPNIKESLSTSIAPNQTAAFRKKTERIDELRKEIKEDYIRASQRRNVISKWREVIQILQTLDIKLLLIAIKVLGDIYMEFDDYENARILFSFYKIVSYRLELFEETMYAYESLGNVYKYLYQYHKAILCYKKLIELAWILGNKEFELRAYDNIGIQYFYLCNKPKAKYHHDRFIYGLYEKDTKTKEAVIENFKNKHYNLFDDDKQLIIRNYSNEELRESIIRFIKLYENNKKFDFDTYDILKNQETWKKSFISDVDMTFQITSIKYLEHDYLNNENEMKKKCIMKNIRKKKEQYPILIKPIKKI
jgi:tetratricopeptide (TPR) repeat protein